MDKKAPGAAAILLDAVNRSFEKDVKVNFNLGMEGLITCDDIANNIGFTSNEFEQPSGTDVRQILESLIHEAESVRILPSDFWTTLEIYIIKIITSSTCSASI